MTSCGVSLPLPKWLCAACGRCRSCVAANCCSCAGVCALRNGSQPLLCSCAWHYDMRYAGSHLHRLAGVDMHGRVHILACVAMHVVSMRPHMHVSACVAMRMVSLLARIHRLACVALRIHGLACVALRVAQFPCVHASSDWQASGCVDASIG